MSNKVAAFLRAQWAAHRLIGRPMRCFYCEVELVDVRTDLGKPVPNAATVDHWTPLGRGGSHSPCNLFVACSRCNGTKGLLTGEEFIPIRHNPTLCRQRSRKLERERNPPTYENRAAKVTAKRERRNERLSQRLRAPDPNCVHCSGEGKIRTNPRVERYCQCSIKPLTEETEAWAM